MEHLGIEINQIQASGGGAKSDLWLQILANVFAKEMIKRRSDGGAASGAALIAGVGVGVFGDFKAACKGIRNDGESIFPDNDRLVYEDFYQLYQSLYGPLKPLFDRDQALVQKYL